MWLVGKEGQSPCPREKIYLKRMSCHEIGQDKTCKRQNGKENGFSLGEEDLLLTPIYNRRHLLLRCPRPFLHPLRRFLYSSWPQPPLFYDQFFHSQRQSCRAIHRIPTKRGPYPPRPSRSAPTHNRHPGRNKVCLLADEVVQLLSQ